MEYLNFNGKKYLIFGASSGIGKQVAFQLSQLGARLVLVGRNEEKLQETLEMLDGDGHNILICDVSDFSAAQNAVKTAVSMDNIKLDGCVFSAGIYAMLPLGAVTEEKINKIIEASIEISNKKLEEICKIENADVAKDLLINDISYEEYDKYMELMNHS